MDLLHRLGKRGKHSLMHRLHRLRPKNWIRKPVCQGKRFRLCRPIATTVPSMPDVTIIATPPCKGMNARAPQLLRKGWQFVRIPHGRSARLSSPELIALSDRIVSLLPSSPSWLRPAIGSIHLSLP